MAAREPAAVSVAIPAPLWRRFDYLPPPGEPAPPAGSRVLVPFGRRKLIGLVWGKADADLEHSRLKSMEQVLDVGLIDDHLHAVVEWARTYYQFPPGEAVNLLLPGALRRAQPFRAPSPTGLALTETGHKADFSRAPARDQVRSLLQSGPTPRQALVDQGVRPGLLATMMKLQFIEAVDPPEHRPVQQGPALNEEQRTALAAVLRARHGFVALLLAGVTGSGKTEVYLQAARRLLSRQRQILILIPEIGLTAQLVRRIEARLGRRAWTYHSGLSEGERLACWHAAREGRAEVIVGTRSAVFMPLRRPGLIVIDEEHDASFKQQEGARYQGRDIAVLRARMLDVPVLLGSATPSLESLNNVDQGRYQLLKLTQRAGGARQPRWQVLDQRGQSEALDARAITAIERHLKAGGQVLVYRNRRGYAPVLMCDSCGWQADCHRCDAHMTWHQHPSRLQCHHCGASRPQPRRCPECGSPRLSALGAGTEQLEETLARRFDGFPVFRADRDVMTGRHDFDELLDRVRSGGPCILVGTQMLAKGHHLPGVTLAVVLDVDQALFSGDFRAPERLGQAVYQVAGRAGRGDLQGEFLLQTRNPEHPLLSELLRADYLQFADRLLKERHQTRLPPAGPLALLRAESHRPGDAETFLREAALAIRAPGIEAIGPIPAIMSRRAGYWRFQCWLQADGRARLVNRLADVVPTLANLPSARRARWHLDMDPIEL